MSLKSIVFFFWIITSTLTTFAQSSVLSQGDWYKLQIEKRGVYKLTYQYLKSAGFDVDNIDPKTLKIYGNPGGMLPQSNLDTRPFDLLENAIYVKGESDGVFNSDDYILFYAEDGDTYEYINDKLIYQHNIYSDVNFYFITDSGVAGKRMAFIDDLGNAFPKITTYNNFGYFKKEKYNLLASGREWFSERFDLTTSFSFDFSFNQLVTNSDIKITVDVMAQSFEPASFDILLNNNKLGNIPVESVPDYTQKVYRYSIKGKENTVTFLANSNLVSNGQLSVGIDFNKNSSSHSIGFLNNIKVETLENLSISNPQLIFRSLKSIENPFSTYQINGANSNTTVWEISNKSVPKIQNINTSGIIASFGTGSDQLKEYVVFNNTLENFPASISKVSNQNLKALTNVEFIIISHPDFKAEAERLASFRISNDNINTKVVLTNQVYNEFSSGRQDLTAFRDFAKYLYTNGKLKYLLLFGRGSYDYKNIIPNNTNFVPIYESRNSLHPLDTYASDDYFGFLEDEEGNWTEINGGNHSLDIGVGRIPVTTLQSAKDVVNKIINYSTNRATLGDWRNNIVFVADDGDFNLHQKQADELTVFIDTTYSAFSPYKFYLDNFPQISRPNGESSPKASIELDDKISKGALIVNFTGHGGENGWMQEQVLDIVQIEDWDNFDRLPLFVTATCEFGRHDDPRKISGGELVVTNGKGGGIAIVSTCRPVSSSSNFELNKAFYEVVYKKTNGEYSRLGDIFKLTKNNSINLATDFNKVGNRNFALLGDPTIRLSYPKNNISINSINNNELKNDTLKALGHIQLGGVVKTSSGQVDVQFNGTVSFTIYDKDITRTTMGNENPPFKYKSKENLIFKGSSSVDQGKFNIEFVVPKNISYEVGTGKINMYAYQENTLVDANGSDIQLNIGSSESNPPEDNSGPEITLFIGDSLNTNLNGVSHNTLLIAKLKDENGINLSKIGVSNDIVAVIDGGESYILNDYYRANKNTYKEGWLEFPLEDLTKGPHSVTLKAWDTYNNSSESKINFTVADPNSIVIYELSNHPNPFNDYTTFRLKHNRAGDNLEFQLEIVSLVSGSILSKSFKIDNSPSEIDFYDWDGSTSTGQKLNSGIYIYRLIVRSLRDGAKNQEYKKLILIN